MIVGTIERELATDPTSPWFDADFGGSGQCDENPTDAINEAAAEWSAQLAQMGSDAMESGSDLAALDAAVAAERGRLLAQLPSSGAVSIDRNHEWATWNKTRRSSWTVLVWTRKPGDPMALCGVGLNCETLTAAGDAALSDLRTKAAVAVAQASQVLPTALPMAPVAAVVGETRAA